MENELIAFFEKHGYEVQTSDSSTIWGTMKGMHKNELQFIYIKSTKRILCVLYNELMNHDIFESGFIIENVEQLQFLIESNLTIRLFFQQLRGETVESHAA